MRNRKQYFDATGAANVVGIGSSVERPWTIVLRGQSVDFRRWLYVGWPRVDGNGTPLQDTPSAERDDLVETVRDAIWEIKNGGAMEATVLNLCASGMRHWFMFLDEFLGKQAGLDSVKQISSKHIERYIEWLIKRFAVKSAKKLRYTSAKAIYSATKSVWTQFVRFGMLKETVFPLNPFPSADREYRGQAPLSKSEMEKVLGCLGADLAAIRDGTFDGEHLDRMAVYFLLVAARTGRNLTPLLELRLDCLEPHPLRDDMWVFQVYKRRGYKKNVMPLRFGVKKGDAASVLTDVKHLIDEAIALGAPMRAQAPAGLHNRVWLTPDPSGRPKAIERLALNRAISRFIGRHALTSDDLKFDGSTKALALNVSRLRKTFGQRIWELSGGNLLRTANLLGNTPRITDSHYLGVTPDMERNHKFVGTILHATVSGIAGTDAFKADLATKLGVSIDRVVQILAGENNTGVGRCSDYLYGRFAPRNGKDVCTRFLHCFRCPNQVVMESDLHRLYSFYWLLWKERAILGRNKWKQVYAWVIREIDNAIAAQFPIEIVEREKARARTNPHPMWMDRSMLGVSVI
ncbi:hypothetical protein DUPY_02730 [Duganella phyllosphaerae]|uniref:Phage integrase family protein n=1 Tax=Duganella phyllosphaerae TaxID=762836 RepID=A0A1E7X7P5_9BURK|nr:hypothetical protein DUPY_02730 [Duganella phyllosphaerae]